ncbi:hypothetical protein N1E27_15935 [Pseudomonas aeruginosa]|nr:hypothetical protein [Pseudomonas aeruginosa]MCS9497605.1 hypothetical protein [Pseudomonas aeruginosa]MCS9603461.1 hypothetical protein [Pseudomonas aeruginosa]MCT1296435.1 hypothetical protein [Pseudomonas aeruginosa]
MSSKTSPDIEAQVVILREAGHTVPAISAQLGLSLSTTKRICKRRGVVAGAATDALIDQARQQMLDTAFELDKVQQQAAALVVEDLSCASLIRQKMLEQLEQIEPGTSEPFKAMRAITAAATTLDLTQKVSRRALPLDKLDEASRVEELSELRIRIMTDDDVREIREQQRREAAEHATGKHRLLHERTAEDDEVVELTPE